MKYAMLVRGGEIFPLMSAWGQKQKSGPAILTSVLPSISDIRQRVGHVRNVPQADSPFSSIPRQKGEEVPVV